MVMIQRYGSDTAESLWVHNGDQKSNQMGCLMFNDDQFSLALSHTLTHTTWAQWLPVWLIPHCLVPHNYANNNPEPLRSIADRSYVPLPNSQM